MHSVPVSKVSVAMIEDIYDILHHVNVASTDCLQSHLGVVLRRSYIREQDLISFAKFSEIPNTTSPQ